MRALFDVNVLLALLDQDHLFHDRTRRWWAGERQHGWASCPLTQNGFVRIISQATYQSRRPVAEALAMLERAASMPEHELWPGDVSILDASRIDRTRLLGPKQLTDITLLALAVKHGGRLVTLDRSISLAAVRGARAEQWVVIG